MQLLALLLHPQSLRTSPREAYSDSSAELKQTLTLRTLTQTKPMNPSLQHRILLHVTILPILPVTKTPRETQFIPMAMTTYYLPTSLLPMMIPLTITIPATQTILLLYPLLEHHFHSIA